MAEGQLTQVTPLAVIGAVSAGPGWAGAAAWVVAAGVACPE